MIEDLDGNNEGLVLMTLREPRTFDIDLSSVDVGEAFTLQSFAMATAYNWIAGPPSESERRRRRSCATRRGSTARRWHSAGLEPIDVDGLEARPDAPLEPPPCPDDVATEGGHAAVQRRRVPTASRTRRPCPRDRAGGTAGPATATITMSDGTATAGVDDTPVNESVVFAAGDDERRAVQVPTIPTRSAAKASARSRSRCRSRAAVPSSDHRRRRK